MTKGNRDPLLIVAKGGTILVRIALVIGMIGLGVAMAVSVVDSSLIADNIAISVEPASVAELTGGLTLVLFLALISLGLMYDFVTQLGRIIDTVGLGDPFTLENARRLRRMGWLAIVVQLVDLPIAMMATWLESNVKEGSFQMDSDISFTGIGLAIVLFILARVFTRGAQMRDELEGTV
ncbi:DUF2975 domain-containing protein [Erythrobacter sp. SG61-1L]|uniref:DUF2975 domain-containing protein n=1 Tax=Erythrobacter sp. SG61-1L TaxID=1603897 RepID=UPI0006C905A8|nr:DUF2975 domain-containing protein [Erythrobacter sp. SG61-1L]